jgi:hypothetical protein
MGKTVITEEETAENLSAMGYELIPLYTEEAAHQKRAQDKDDDQFFLPPADAEIVMGSIVPVTDPLEDLREQLAAAEMDRDEQGYWMRQARADSLNLRRQVIFYRKGIEAIAKGEGSFSRDPLEHASNTIEEMKALATNLLVTVEPPAPEGPTGTVEDALLAWWNESVEPQTFKHAKIEPLSDGRTRVTLTPHEAEIDEDGSDQHHGVDPRA